MSQLGGPELSALLWAGVLGAIPLVGLRWLDSSWGFVVILQSVTPLVGSSVALLLVAAAVTGRWRITAVAAVLLTVVAVIALPLVIRHTVAPGRDDLVLMSANLRYGEAEADSLVTAVRDHRVDVLVLVEVTPEAVERLRLAGLDALLPESAGRPRVGAKGVVIRGRLPMTLLDPGLSTVSSAAPDQPVVSIHRTKGDVMLRGVHTQAPLLARATEWRSGLADLQVWRERQALGKPLVPLVMAGDFNASWGHPGFRRAAETLTDAHRAAGQGWVRSWPQGRRLIRAFVQLDHILVRGLNVVDAGTVTLPNTDHSAVWTRLALPATTPEPGR